MNQTELYYISKEPNSIDSNTKLIIMLHGYGSHENDLYSFSSELPENILIISARAPLSIGFGGYAWYTIHFDNVQGKFSDTDEAKSARDQIAAFIDTVQERYNISPQNTILLGFSQGTILSYAVSLYYPEKVQKVIALSGYINADLLPAELDKNQYTHHSYFISHGTVDQVIPVAWAQKAPQFMESMNITHVYKEYPVGHGVAPQNFFDFRKWLEAII